MTMTITGSSRLDEPMRVGESRWLEPVIVILLVRVLLLVRYIR